jgi:hypothetical protein
VRILLHFSALLLLCFMLAAAAAAVAFAASTGSGEEESDEEEEQQRQQEQQDIEDATGTNLVNLRRTIYLTIMSSLDFEEAGHKLMKIQLAPGQVGVLFECCYCVTFIVVSETCSLDFEEAGRKLMKI